MGTVHNPTQYDLFCTAIKRIIRSGETVTNVEEKFIKKIDSRVFEVASGIVTRDKKQNGSKVVETDAAPKVETR